MEYSYQNGHAGGGGGGGSGGGRGRSVSTTSSSSDLNHSSSNSNHSLSLSHNNSHSNSNNHNHNHPNHHTSTTMNQEDPMQCWWESVSKARSRIQTLISLLPPNSNSHDSLSSLADSDRPARSLLDSHPAYSAVSSALTGSGDDPLCQWLYDTFQQDDSDLRLVVLSFVPILAGLYLTAVHSSSTTSPIPDSPSMAGFEAVLLAIYSAETKSRAGKPLLVSVPSPAYLATNSSLYHTATTASPPSRSAPSRAPAPAAVVCEVCPPLEPQVGIKSTKRATIIGVAFHCFYTQVSHMPPWSKVDLCRYAASWAGDQCPCTVSFDNENFNDNDDSLPLDSLVISSPPQINNQQEKLMTAPGGGGGSMRIPLAWEMLQPMLRIVAHCLMAPPPLITDDIKEAAALAVARLYARASHDLSSQAIIATRSLVQLHQRACATAKAAAIAAAAAAAAAASSSFPSTPSSAHKKQPEMLLLSK